MYLRIMQAAFEPRHNQTDTKYHTANSFDTTFLLFLFIFAQVGTVILNIGTFSPNQDFQTNHEQLSQLPLCVRLTKFKASSNMH